jgi:cytochrome b subunit of formate dehydrogenase
MKTSFILFFSVLAVLFFAASPSLRAQSSSDCLACHSDQSMTMERGGKEIKIGVDEKALHSSVHGKLACIACHTGFDPGNLPHKAKIQPINCTTCHKNAGQVHPFHPDIAIAMREGRDPDVTCKDCHGTHTVSSPKKPGSRFSTEKLAESCGECHSDVNDMFAKSAHGVAMTAGLKGAPNCLTCHMTEISGDHAPGDSLKHKVAQEKLCLSCHLDNPDVRQKTSPTAGFIAAYENSVHGAALTRGVAAAANCVDCHGSHEMKKGLDPTAKVYKINIPATCSKCHSAIAGEFGQSVHGVALAAGNMDAPACTDCHGEHNILKHNDPRSRVAAANLSAQVCSPCHSSLALSTKYGLDSDRFKTFSDSYHGLALRGGSVEVANCASCHGAHNIKPSSDSTSMIHKSNLAVTCGKCHPGANERFGVGAVHVTMAKQEEPLLYWMSTIYLIMIIVVIGGMLLHNFLDFLKKSRRKLMIRRGELAEEHFGHSLYVRMTANERAQHAALVISFVVLVVTGFMLRFPDAWWVRGVRAISDDVFDLRSLIHRIAAVVMVIASLYHTYYISMTKRGRELVRDLFPVLQDAKDAIAVMKYNTGFSTVKPKFGRFSYIEKSEYWALVWGTIVMAATGFVMWFDNTFIGLFTKLGYDVARVIHYYEAWLATLAIIVWHFYYVIFNPDTYPINLAFWKGTLTEHEMVEEHPLELEEIKRRNVEEVNGDDEPNGMINVREDSRPGKGT